MGKQKDWKPRTIRISDELWFTIMGVASKEHKEMADLIREVLEDKFN